MAIGSVIIGGSTKVDNTTLMVESAVKDVLNKYSDRVSSAVDANVFIALTLSIKKVSQKCGRDGIVTLQQTSELKQQLMCDKTVDNHVNFKTDLADLLLQKAKQDADASKPNALSAGVIAIGGTMSSSNTSEQFLSSSQKVESIISSAVDTFINANTRLIQDGDINDITQDVERDCIVNAGQSSILEKQTTLLVDQIMESFVQSGLLTDAKQDTDQKGSAGGSGLGAAGIGGIVGGLAIIGIIAIGVIVAVKWKRSPSAAAPAPMYAPAPAPAYAPQPGLFGQAAPSGGAAPLRAMGPSNSIGSFS